MKKFFSKTYKFNKLTVSIFSNEIVFIIIGSRKVYIKTVKLKLPSVNFSNIKAIFSRFPYLLFKILTINVFSNDKLHRHKKRVAFSVSAIIVILVLMFSFYPEKENNPVFDEDEVMKNDLLKSSQTDYSSPKKYKKLVITEHKVKKGENLSLIAKKYGVSISTICGTNNLRSYHLIREGKILKVPNKDGLIYKMRKGNKLVSIANKYKVSLQKIIDANNIKNPDFIASSSMLFIPDAKPQNIFSGFLWPTFSRRINCGYGWRRNPFNRRSREFHPGLDIRARYQWVKASKYGKITYTGWLGGYGKAIIIAHPGGWKTLYGHLSRIIVRRGQYVKQGQSIAKSGNTGRSTGAHLHFEILKKGRHKNPYRYLRRRRR